MKVLGHSIMKRKVQASLTFRKNTPGERLSSIKSMADYKGQLYAFQYTSHGPIPSKPRRNIDRRPVLLLAYKKGEKVWKAKNGKSYIYGFNLNYLPASKRLKVINNLIEIFGENPGQMFSYKMIKSHLSLRTSTEDSIFRKYDVRGSKLRYLKEINLDKYRAYLEKSLDKDK
jgi:hypothetical protein